MSVPYIYKKIADMLRNNGNGKMKMPAMRKELSKVRITNSDMKHIMRDLEKHGIVELEAKKINQHFNIKVAKKGTVNMMIIMVAVLTLLLGVEITMAISMLGC